MMNKAILYSLFLFTLVASCNKAAYKPPADALHQDTNSAAKETADEVETHEDVALAVVPIANSTAETVDEVETHEDVALAVVPIANSTAKDTVDEVETHEDVALAVVPIANSTAETADEVETHEDVALAVVPIPNAAREPIIDRYIHFTFGRGVNESNDNGDTPLMEAIKNPDIDETSMFMLLEHPGIELDRRAQDTAEHTALHLAAIHGKSDVVRTLLDKGADVNAKTKSCWTSFYEGKKLVIMLDNDEHTALHVAAIYGKSDVVRTLLDKGADVNAKTKTFGRTALCEAAIHDKSDVVRTLIDKGADVNAKIKCWLTALHVAAMHGSSDIVRILLDKGADVNAKDSFGLTALHLAAMHGSSDIVRTLLDKGARVNEKTHIAAANDKPPIGSTALSEAISNGHQAVATLLRDAGAR